jgi:hypothetical protein
MVDTFSVLVTAPVTRKVQGPMTTTWHTPPPAPAARPATKGDAPPASSESLIFSLLYLRRARRRHAPAARQPCAHAARKKQPRVFARECVCAAERAGAYEDAAAAGCAHEDGALGGGLEELGVQARPKRAADGTAAVSEETSSARLAAGAAAATRAQLAQSSKAARATQAAP